jgi:2-methylcitrate dehydratase PrpD
VRNLTLSLAEYAATVDYESLRPEVVAVIKRILLDTLGTTLAANTLGVGCRQIIEFTRNCGGIPESTLIGFAEKAPAVMAAFANGAMAHALNYDAIGAEGGHLGVVALAAPLAVAEKVGGVGGKDFIAAIAAGTELTARLAAAANGVRRRSGAARPLEGQILGYFGATASAGRVLKLDAEQMHSAFGLALMQASGSLQPVLDGDPPAKAVYGAFPNHGAVVSALLSELNLGAACDVFEGESGLFAAHYGREYDRAALDRQLGEDFYVLQACFKPWPTSAVVHPFIEATLRLLSADGPAVDQIDRIHIHGGVHIKAWCEPIEERRNPRNSAAAANSIFFAVAKALANGRVVLADFTAAGLSQAEVIQLSGRMDYRIDNDLGRSGVVEIETKTGRHYSSRVDARRGQSMTDSQLVEKFLDCAQYAERGVSRAVLEEAIMLINQLETVPDVRLLASLFT